MTLRKHQPRKRFGQHFLIDRSVIEAIVRAVAPRDGDERAGERQNAQRDELLEIGPGQAALTDALLQRVGHLTAIEIDRDLARRLRSRYPPDRLTLIEADALTFDYRRTAGRWRLVGNLPYNISSPLLVHLVQFREQVADQHFMLQKEVVDRIAAQPGTADYGRLTVLVQTYYAVQALFDVEAMAFDPPPKVTSAVLRMMPLRGADEPPLAVMEALLAQAFAQRRKMLRNTLLPWLAARGIADSGLAPTARPEEVPVADYVALARRLSMSSIS